MPRPPTHPSFFLQICFNVTFPFPIRSSERFLAFLLTHKNTVPTFPVSHTCHTSQPSNYSWFDHLNYMWWEASIMEFLTTQCFPVPSSHGPLGPKIPSSALYSPAPSMQGWRTYGTCAQNGTWKGFLGTWHSQLPQFFSLNCSCPTSFSILWTVRVYTHTWLCRDCIWITVTKYV
jgi:hypothetical protein